LEQERIQKMSPAEQLKYHQQLIEKHQQEYQQFHNKEKEKENGSHGSNPTPPGSPGGGGGGEGGELENYEKSDVSKSSKPVIAANWTALPEDYKSIVKGWDIKQPSIDLHWDIILSLLHFQTKIKFYSQEPPKTERRKYYPITYQQSKTVSIQSEPNSTIISNSSSNKNSSNNTESTSTTTSTTASTTSSSSTTITTKFQKKPFDQLCKKPSTDIKKLYTIRERVGKGGFGQVYLAKSNVDKSRSRIAIKRLPHIRKKEKKFNMKEVRVLEFAKHPNIISYHESFHVSDEIWIVMEFMEGGTLSEASHQYPFQESNIAYVAREVLQGLQYLHGHNLVHRDLKSQNIMMTTAGEIKLIDFGLCANLVKGERIRMCGSPLWMSPEMIQQKPHGYQVDVWSLGICVLELANRTNKLRRNPVKTMFMVGSEGIKEPFEDPNKWSDNFHDFISKCLQIDPSKRPSCSELLKHPFLEIADNKKKMGKILSSIFLKNIVGI